MSKNKMTLDELKAIAKDMGYYLMPISRVPKKEPCPVCGTKILKPRIILGGRKQFFCPKCGFEGRAGKGEIKSAEGWNKAVKMYYIYKELENKNGH